MKKIATLGPKGTFTDIAAKKYLTEIDSDIKIEYYNSFIKTFKAIGNDCDLGIIPIENTLDGYVQRTLDNMLFSDLNIVCDLKIPIQFAFVSHSENILDLKKVYVQFKTQGQCAKFLDKFSAEIINTTESNSTSFRKFLDGKKGEAAIIPMHLLKENNDFKYVIDNVTDATENETRFVVLSKDKIKLDIKFKKYKTTIAIIEVDDRPGMLHESLYKLSKRKLNVVSLVSRPTKKSLGDYSFFLDIEGDYYNNKDLYEAIQEINKNNMVKILGVYPSI